MTVPPPVEPQKRSEAPVQQLAPVLTAQSTPAASTRGDSSSRILADHLMLQEHSEFRDRDRRSMPRSTPRLRSPDGR